MQKWYLDTTELVACDGCATIKKGWEKAWIAGVVDGKIVLHDKDPYSVILKWLLPSLENVIT